jgi:hypothetical protein
MKPCVAPLKSVAFGMPPIVSSSAADAAEVQYIPDGRELIALRPRHIDILRQTMTVEEAIVEVSKKHSGTGERVIIKPYAKDDESRIFGVRSVWLDEVARHIRVHAIGRDDLLFSTEGTPISRNTSERECGCRLSKRRASTSVFGSMIFGMRTRRGFLLAARISRA